MLIETTNNGTDKAPVVSPELVRYLDELYPDSAPDGPVVYPAQESYRAGQVSVVRYLKQLLKEQKGEDTPTEAYVRL